MTQTQPLRYYPQLDAIRAFAVAGVMVHHLWFEAGFLASLGVRLFFTISGFLITQILIHSRETAHARLAALWRFYARRMLRIFPLYYLVIAIGLVFGLPPTRELFWWLISYLLNFKIASQGWFEARYAHFWSLCVEEQFYLVWPWAIFFLPRRRLQLAAIGLIATAIGFRLLYILSGYTLTSGIGTFVLPFGSLDSLGMGALLAVAVRERTPGEITGVLRRACPAALAVLAALLWAEQVRGWSYMVRFSVEDSLEGVLFCGILWSAVQSPAEGWGAILRWAPLLYLGKISYGLYVYHPFLPEAIGWVCGWLHIPPPGEFGMLRFFLVASAGAVGLASVSWYLYEAPLNGLKRYFRDSPVSN